MSERGTSYLPDRDYPSPLPPQWLWSAGLERVASSSGVVLRRTSRGTVIEVSFKNMYMPKHVLCIE